MEKLAQALRQNPYSYKRTKTFFVSRRKKQILRTNKLAIIKYSFLKLDRFFNFNDRRPFVFCFINQVVYRNICNDYPGFLDKLTQL